MFLLGAFLFIGRIVFESTALTSANGPQMVGFALFHGAYPIFLIGLVFVPLLFIWTMAALILGGFQQIALFLGRVDLARCFRCRSCSVGDSL